MNKRIINGLCVLGLVGAAAFAGVGSVVASFPAPASNPTDLTWANGYLYCYCRTAPYMIYKINPSNGNVAGSYSFPFVTADCAGLAYDGSFFLATNRASDYCYRFKLDGTVLASYHVSWNIGEGLGWGNLHLWGTEHLSNPSGYRIHEMRADCIVVHTLTYYYQPFDITYDGQYLWLADYDTVAAEGHIIGLLPDGYTGFRQLAPGSGLRGMAHDGNYLWASTLGDGGRLWKIETRGVAVEPSSLGRVRAVYR